MKDTGLPTRMTPPVGTQPSAETSARAHGRAVRALADHIPTANTTRFLLPPLPQREIYVHDASGISILSHENHAAGVRDLAQKKKAVRNAIVVASIGNGREWFDLIVYGAFAVTISKLFFPTGDETAFLLLTFASFGAAFIMRPLGGVISGRYADRAGRRAGLLAASS